MLIVFTKLPTIIEKLFLKSFTDFDDILYTLYDSREFGLITYNINLYKVTVFDILRGEKYKFSIFTWKN